MTATAVQSTPPPWGDGRDEWFIAVVSVLLTFVIVFPLYLYI